MKFKELYELQAELDKEIHLNHKTDYSKTMNERTLAFMVEMGEFANETRCFKYWSNKGPSERSVILEEYIDALHFILSLGLATNFKAVQDLDYTPNVSKKSLTEDIIDMYQEAKLYKDNPSLDLYKSFFEKFLGIASKLGFSREDLVEAYYAKNNINHQRQHSNY